MRYGKVFTEEELSSTEFEMSLSLDDCIDYYEAKHQRDRACALDAIGGKIVGAQLQKILLGSSRCNVIQYVYISPSLESYVFAIRATHYDVNGIAFHDDYYDVEAALDDVVRQGFIHPAQRSFDEIALLPSFIKGNMMVEERSRESIFLMR